MLPTFSSGVECLYILCTRILVHIRRQDVNRFKYIKRLLKRYELTGDLQERLILNHLIVLFNVFGIDAGNRMIWYKVNEEHWHYIKPFLVYLHYLPENEKINVGMDPYIVEVLREL